MKHGLQVDRGGLRHRSVIHVGVSGARDNTLYIDSLRVVFLFSS